MGSPKALLDYGGETFADRLVGVFQNWCEPVVVVLGHNAEAIRAGLRCCAVVAVNPAPERGQLSSLQCGLAMLPGDVAGFFFTPVDSPGVRPETVAGLIAAIGDAPLALPRFDGRNGHPALCSRRLIGEFLQLPAEARTHEAIHRHRDKTIFVDVDDPAVVSGANTPEEYQKLITLRDDENPNPAGQRTEPRGIDLLACGRRLVGLFRVNEERVHGNADRNNATDRADTAP
jgi:molybdenum cofactor cytidylyltransferase